MSDTNKERQKAVREAWNSERTLVRKGEGTRQWSQAEQREILAIGKAHGYEGHHMLSVNGHPQQAGNPKDIQFLTHSEHRNGAHHGNTRNPTDGYYNPDPAKCISFKNSTPMAPVQSLSSPLTQRQQNLAAKKGQIARQAAANAKNEAAKQPTASVKYPNAPAGKANQASASHARPSHRSSAEAIRKGASAAKSGQSIGQSASQAIKNPQSAATAKPGGSQHNSASQAIKSHQGSTAHPGGSQQGGSQPSKGSGKGR